MGILQGKRALIVGVANNRSIAWGISKAFKEQGAELAFSYQNERLKGRVEKLAAEAGSDLVFECDVSEERQVEQLFTQLGEHWDGLDVIVHAVAFAPKEELEGSYLDSVTREGFRIAHDISSYSFTALARAGQKMLEGRNGSLLTLSYLGAVRAIPHYNVMGLAKASLEANVRYMAASLGPKGIRVNGISAGPIKTLAAAGGVGDFRKLLAYSEKNSPLKRNVTIEEVGNTAAFLCSDMASGITGEITYVDCGYNVTGMMVD